MNKFDNKILEIAPKEGTIHDLLRRKVRSGLFQFVDMMYNNIFLTIDHLESTGAYYLIVEKNKATLVHIDKDLQVSRKDITNIIQTSGNKNSFEYEGYKYKLYRKVR